MYLRAFADLQRQWESVDKELAMFACTSTFETRQSQQTWVNTCVAGIADSALRLNLCREKGGGL
jgi:hypothetical protein